MMRVFTEFEQQRKSVRNQHKISITPTLTHSTYAKIEKSYIQHIHG
jgi:hypothetical protein